MGISAPRTPLGRVNCYHSIPSAINYGYGEYTTSCKFPWVQSLPARMLNTCSSRSPLSCSHIRGRAYWADVARNAHNMESADRRVPCTINKCAVEGRCVPEILGCVSVLIYHRQGHSILCTSIHIPKTGSFNVLNKQDSNGNIRNEHDCNDDWVVKGLYPEDSLLVPH